MLKYNYIMKRRPCEGELAIAIIIPFLTIGRYKNIRYAKDSAYRARIDVMNENPEAASFQPAAEPAGH